MRFPNAYKGIKRIWLAELLMLLVAVLGIVALIVTITNSTINGDVMTINNEGAVSFAAILAIVIAIVALVAFVLNLFGLLKARIDDGAFKTALYVTALGVVASVVSSIWSQNKMLVDWMTIATTLFTMLASYYVMTGIANLADKLQDDTTMNLAMKARALLEGSFCATMFVRIIIRIFNVPQGKTLYIILTVLALVLEIVSYLVYMWALSKGKIMLASARAENVEKEVKEEKAEKAEKADGSETEKK